MKNNLIGKCPICGKELKVTELSCNNCKTKISGDFHLNNFCKLNDEERYFAEVFIKNRGNIKEIEKELGVSYPTVRKLLDQVIVSLGYTTKVNNNNDQKNIILDKLSKGDISSQEALELINNL